MFREKFHSTDEQNWHGHRRPIPFSDQAKKYLMIMGNLLCYRIPHWSLTDRGRVIHTPLASWMKIQRKLGETRASSMKKEGHSTRWLNENQRQLDEASLV